MRCTNPIRLRSKYKAGDPYLVPCGQCLACRLNYGRMWSIRIMHEATLHKHSCFVTLTYSDEHLPPNGSLVKSYPSEFIKRLRARLGYVIRFFASGEYGDRNNRPHYHLAIFGLSVSDETRRLVSSVHGLGYICVDALELDSARYIAGYVLKKVKGKHAKEYYEKKGIIPEFAVMSLRPGIGRGILEKHGESLRSRGYTVVKGIKYGLPRYYKDILFDESDRAFVETKKEAMRIAELTSTLNECKLIGKDLGTVRRESFAQVETDINARQGLKRRKL